MPVPASRSMLMVHSSGLFGHVQGVGRSMYGKVNHTSGICLLVICLRLLGHSLQNFCGFSPLRTVQQPAWLHSSITKVLTFFQLFIRFMSNILSAELKERGNLTVAGDGRADSPGHSAKCGTYSVIELTCTRW